MLYDMNTLNRMIFNSLPVDYGFTAPVGTEVSAVVYFRASLANLFSYFYPVYNEDTQFDIIGLRGVTAHVPLEEDVELLLRDWSDARGKFNEVDIFEPVGIFWDNYVKTTFYPMYSKGDMSVSITVQRPINPEPFVSTSSMEVASALKQWAYYIGNESKLEAGGTVGVTSTVYINNEAYMTACGSLIVDQVGTQILNTSDMKGGDGNVYLNGYLKLYLCSNDCCIYPEAQIEEAIDCDGNEIHKQCT